MLAPRILAGAILLAAMLAVPVSAAVADDPPPVAAVDAPTGVDDFTFDSFSADYTLGRDGAGRSTLLTVETLVAVFPDYDQNRGIIRAIPTKYDGHGTQIDVKSVTDAGGSPRDFAMGTDGDFTTITIAVPEGQYVHGSQTYVITYTQANVTQYFKDTNDDEFYWDTNGTGWDQPFGSITARVHVEPALQDALTGQNACYFGYEGATQKCEIAATPDGVSASATDASARQNLTVAVGFEPRTFAAAPFNPLDYIPLAPLLAILALLSSVALAVVARLTVLRDHRGSTVVAQYEPQPGVSPWLAANIWGKPKKGMSATIIDLAVRGKVRILERDSPSGRGKQYGVQEVDDSGLEQDSARAMYVLFSTGFFSAPSRSERWFTQRDVLLGSQVQSLSKSIEAEEIALGLRRKAPRWPAVVMVVLAVVAFLIFLFGTFGEDDNGVGIVFGVLGANLVPWLTIFLIVQVAGRKPLTEAGARVHDYLEGMRLYIRLAEADRLQMLQSVTGAERISGKGGGGDVVKIYEKLLPYALIFGLEREWGETLEQYYGSTPPDWYSGDSFSAFQAGAFASGIASFTSSVSSTTSYSSSGGSSSGGGSSGGGSSGGGGGGGGGGGI